MLIFAADDEKLMLEKLVVAIQKAEPNAEVRDSQRSSQLLKAIEEGATPDVVFLDIEMPGLSGIGLAKKIKITCPQTNIVFATGFSQYAIEALKLYPSGYIMKPITSEAVRSELDNLRFPIKVNKEKKLYIRTFSNFEVFVDDKPVIFERNRSKELFAYLVDRCGTSASYAEIAGILWDDGIYDRSRQKQLQVFLHDMMKNLKLVGALDVIVKKRTGIMIDVTKIDCDAYRFAAGDIAAINAYRGDYMSAYSWAEFTNGRFTQMLEKF